MSNGSHYVTHTMHIPTISNQPTNALIAIQYNTNHGILFMTSIKLLHVSVHKCKPRGSLLGQRNTILTSYVMCMVQKFSLPNQPNFNTCVSE